MPETNMVLIWNLLILESSSCWKTFGLERADRHADALGGEQQAGLQGAAAEESALIAFMSAALPCDRYTSIRRFGILGVNTGWRTGSQS
jgi:hypothetical protein